MKSRNSRLCSSTWFWIFWKPFVSFLTRCLCALLKAARRFPITLSCRMSQHCCVLIRSPVLVSATPRSSLLQVRAPVFRRCDLTGYFMSRIVGFHAQKLKCVTFQLRPNASEIVCCSLRLARWRSFRVKPSAETGTALTCCSLSERFLCVLTLNSFPQHSTLTSICTLEINALLKPDKARVQLQVIFAAMQWAHECSAWLKSGCELRSRCSRQKICESLV